MLGKKDIEKVHAVYEQVLAEVGNVISEFIAEHEREYLAFPYLNKRVDMNLILWQQISRLTQNFLESVSNIMSEKYFGKNKAPERPFSVYGYVDNGKSYGGGWDGVYAENVCGYSKIWLENIYITRIKKHFSCGHNIASDAEIQLALRAVEGLDVSALTEAEKEHAAKAIECGYLYKEEEKLYTKILVCDSENSKELYAVSDKLRKGYFDALAEEVAEKVYEILRKAIPDYLLGEWRLANILAGMPVEDGVVEVLIQKKILIPPKDGIGAEGCWMCVSR